MKLLDCLDRDPCEWHPAANRPAVCSDEWHADADVYLGQIDGWRLCRQCAELPRFKRYRSQRATQP